MTADDRTEQMDDPPAGESGPPQSDRPAESESHEPVTSPTLEHLDQTMKAAKQAADEALAPQRD